MRLLMDTRETMPSPIRNNSSPISTNYQCCDGGTEQTGVLMPPCTRARHTGCMYAIDGLYGQVKSLSLQCNANAVKGEHSRHKPNSVASRTRRMIRPPAALCRLPVGITSRQSNSVPPFAPPKAENSSSLCNAVLKIWGVGSLTPPFHIPQPHALWSAI